MMSRPFFIGRKGVKMKKQFALLLALTMLFSFSRIAYAGLTTIGTATYQGDAYNLIYEDDNINGGLVWLDYTNDGLIWSEQVNWASGLGENLTIVLYPDYETTIDWSTGWRLPETDESKADLYGPWGTDVGRGDGFGWGGPDQSGYHDYYRGYNMQNSEMAHLWYKSLGNKGSYSTDGDENQPGAGLTNVGDFNNLQTHSYWSATEYSPNTDLAWRFDFNNGDQSDNDKIDYPRGLPVRPGEITVVPIPGAVWLLGSGLIALVGLRKKFKR
jgi:hypothetical protein